MYVFIKPRSAGCVLAVIRVEQGDEYVDVQ